MGLSKKNKKTVDDEGTTNKHSSITIETTASINYKEKLDYAGTDLVEVGRCSFCGCLGVIVDYFPRRGYGKREYTREMLLEWIRKKELGLKIG